MKPEIQKQLAITQEEIGFKYLRFHGIFDDDMMVYNEDETGNPRFDFSKTDEMIKFLYSVGLKPFLELGFMPSQLAKNIKKIFFKPSVISLPKDMNIWCLLIRDICTSLHQHLR